MKRILESGHYYQCLGPTSLSVRGWQILQQLQADGDKTLLMVDDVHRRSEAHPEERQLPIVEFAPQADFSLLESELRPLTAEVLKMLRNPKIVTRARRRPRQRGGQLTWHCSGSPITKSDGIEPARALYDTALCLYKFRLGFEEAVNILPYYYAWEQQHTRRLVGKILPGKFRLRTILYNEERFWEVE